MVKNPLALAGLLALSAAIGAGAVLGVQALVPAGVAGIDEARVGKIVRN